MSNQVYYPYVYNVETCTTDTTQNGYCQTCSPYPSGCTFGWDCTSDSSSCS